MKQAIVQPEKNPILQSHFSLAWKRVALYLFFWVSNQKKIRVCRTTFLQPEKNSILQNHFSPTWKKSEFADHFSGNLKIISIRVQIKRLSAYFLTLITLDAKNEEIIGNYQDYFFIYIKNFQATVGKNFPLPLT